MIDVEPLIVSELERMLPLPDGHREDWSDVLRRAGLTGAGHVGRRGLAPTGQRRWRPVLVAAVVVAALVGVGVAIADGFGAFNGISAAQNTPTGSDVLPPALLAQIEQMNAENQSNGAAQQLLPDTARVLATTPDGAKVYGLTDAGGDLLCLIGAEGGSCGPPLSHSQPITMTGTNPSPTTGGTFTAEGVAIDGVTSVSFTVAPGDGQEVTVPVQKNFWIYTEPDSHGVAEHCVVAHLADGSTVKPFPEVPCP